MIPSTNGYTAVPTEISQILHLQQVIRLPNINFDAEPVAGPTRSIVATSGRPPRPQPKGLRMRYFHSGFGERDPGILGFSESEGEVATAVRSTPKEKQHHSKKAEMRKHEAEGEASPSKKHRKTRDSEEAKKRREKKEKRRLKEAAKAQ